MITTGKRSHEFSSMCRDVKNIFSCLFGVAGLYYYRRTRRVFNPPLELNSWVNRVMEANYDEDLSQNPFLQELQTEHRLTFEKAIKEGWIICVPRCGSFSRGSLLEDDFLSHILVPKDKQTGINNYLLIFWIRIKFF